MTLIDWIPEDQMKHHNSLQTGMENQYKLYSMTNLYKWSVYNFSNNSKICIDNFFDFIWRRGEFIVFVTDEHVISIYTVVNEGLAEFQEIRTDFR